MGSNPIRPAIKYIRDMPILLTRKRGMVQAHDLCLDIVCEAISEKMALGKLRLATEAYIEFGIRKGWQDDIPHPAPRRYWDQLNSETLRSY